MLLSVLATLLIGFSPALPQEVPDIESWPVIQAGHVERWIGNDLLRSSEDGGRTLRFIQGRGICPADLGGDCRYTARYELRALAGGKGYVHRYVVVGPTGVRAEGLLIAYSGTGNRYLYFRNDGRWEPESVGEDEGVSATIVAVLYEMTKGMTGN